MLGAPTRQPGPRRARKALLPLALGALLVAALAGCGGGSDEPETGAGDPPEVATSESPVTGATGATGETGATGTTGAPARPLPRVALPERIEGLNWTAYTADGYGTAEARRDLARFRALHSTTVTLVPTWYMPDGRSDRIAPDPVKTPSDESLARAIAWARQMGLAPILKPHVDVTDGTFRGDIQPADRAAWFRSYSAFLDHYAELAEQQGVALLTVGTELKTLSSDTGEWQALIASVRDRYRGPLTYAANWDEVERIQFWGDLDLIGVDAYYPLSKPGEDPGVGRLIAAWDPIVERLRRLSRRWGKPVIFTELGYPSQPGATAHPFEVIPGEPPDDAIQKRAYDAAFQAFFGKPWFRGISWWSWRADTGAAEDPAIDYTPEGKPAEDVLLVSQSG